VEAKKSPPAVTGRASVHIVFICFYRAPSELRNGQKVWFWIDEWRAWSDIEDWLYIWGCTELHPLTGAGDIVGETE
jgi:hypothetical protein